jgi:hypothetical protein
MQMNSTSTREPGSRRARYPVACRDAGIARPQQSQKHPAATYGPSGQRQPATSHSESNRVSGAYLRAFALDMNRPNHRRRRCLA